MQKILSLDDPRIKNYRNLKKPKIGENFFIAENEKVVQRLLQSSLSTKSILGTEIALEHNDSFIRESKLEPTAIYSVSKELMESIVGFSIHRGIMAEAEIPGSHNLEDLPQFLDSELDIPPPIVMLNRIYDSENIGAIIRSSRAFGVKNLIYDKRSSHPYLRRSVRVSMGNIFDMNIIYSTGLEEAIQKLQSLGYKVFGASLEKREKGLQSIYEFSFPNKWAIILGNEAEGIEMQNLDLCDQLIHIPMEKNVDSLNVAHSLTAFLSVWKTKTAPYNWMP